MTPKGAVDDRTRGSHGQIPTAIAVIFFFFFAIRWVAWPKEKLVRILCQLMKSSPSPQVVVLVKALGVEKSRPYRIYVFILIRCNHCSF